ncbi:MAG: hypothetical protein A2Y81_06660 [Nitrospirae bacterium RBG_13_43_8]|nr:MAG: hypothetical protein A2Y81_06660 [Nitrospirae bacterium RBG_13_43_8]
MIFSESPFSFIIISDQKEFLQALLWVSIIIVVTFVIPPPEADREPSFDPEIQERSRTSRNDRFDTQGDAAEYFNIHYHDQLENM